MVMDVQPAVQPAQVDSRTAPSLAFELFAADTAPESALERYATERAGALLDDGIASAANVFRLREQQVPATPLAAGVISQLAEAYRPRLMAFGDDRGAANPLPEAVFAAAYQLASDDQGAAEEALRGTSDAGARTLSRAVFTKLIDWGRPNPAGDEAFQAAMIVVTHPTDLGYVDQFNDWYTHNHMIDVAKSPPYRSASRYRLARHLEGVPLPYVCIYEIEAPYSERLHPDMMHQVGVQPWVDRLPQPATPEGQPVLTIDFWGYYERAWASGAPRT